MNKSSVLILHQDLAFSSDFGVDIVKNESHFFERLKQNYYPVVVMSATQAASKLESIKAILGKSFVILVRENISPEYLQKLVNSLPVFKILSSFERKDLELSLKEALAEYDLRQQNNQLVQLFEDQNQKLITLNQELDRRIRERQTYLVESREKALKGALDLEALQRTFLALNRAKSFNEIERNLSDALGPYLSLSWIRLQMGPTSFESYQAQKFSLFSSPLTGTEKTLGHVYFARDLQKPFTTNEEDFLIQVSETLALSVERILKLEGLKELKEQWELTFDAVNLPLSLVNSSYELLQINSAFASKVKRPKSQILGQKCYQVLFDRKTSCEFCILGTTMGRQKPLENSSDILEITSQKVSANTYTNVYQDVTHQTRLENQLLEISKQADLGVIGSSMAHELNNPLAAMLTFTQLLKSDISEKEKYFGDIVEIEKGLLRSRDIVQNLLSFTRVNEGSSQKINLKLAVEKAISLVQIQARSLGIKIEIEVPDFELVIQESTLLQTLLSLLQYSIDAIKKYPKDPDYQPCLNIKVEPVESYYCVKISDNGMNRSPVKPDSRQNFDLAQGLSSTQYLVETLKANLKFPDFEETTELKVRSVLSLPRPDFRG